MSAYNCLEDHCEQIDASVFSGDLLFDPVARNALKECAERWLREIKRHEASTDLPDDYEVN